MANSTLSADQRAELDRLEDALQSGSIYDLLGLKAEAELKEIQDAYYRLSRSWHPDRFFRMDLGNDANRIEHLFVSITHAYKTLSDPLKRRNYDRNELPQFNRRGTHREAMASRAASPDSSIQTNRSMPKTPSSRGIKAESTNAESAAGPDLRPASPSSTVAPAAQAPRRRTWREQTRRRATSTGDASNARRALGRAAASDTDAERTQARAPRRANQADRIREELKARLLQAKAYYEQGIAELEKEQILKAASSLYLATTYEPSNETYKKAFDKANQAARRIQAHQLVQQAEAAESYQRVKEAIAHYRKATELDPDNARANYRLALLVRRFEEDDREALTLLRKAVMNSPRDTDYRLALGELYADLDMGLNARREFKTILDLDRGHEAARAALKKLR